ncbi:hypothetical protein CB0940_10346 [Cercospora beticola]|uniref:IgE-binding protein n=1 Tax=Cercospora beticola TaxID=122368 RepID=A0A2G5HUG5_CERBT|nr:hypothetical protein CB0940_10346 [Cercospora beticola]PIA96179.1 hypothetical protein CB0940_10346 [Cercospora beticola]WPB07060.1 hypothetical protein RHO25_011720 [Cercospora beticola]
MKTTILLSLALAAISHAIALPQFPVSKLPNQFFSLMALRSATPIHFGGINANRGHLWIGKQPSTYCPGVQGLNCAGVNTTRTTFALSNGVLSLAVQVSEGQKVYIESCGRVSYTRADDSDVPADAVTSGWSLDRGPNFDILSHENGTYFCPSTDVDPQAPPVAGQPGRLPGPWEFYVGITKDLPEGCLYASLVAAGNAVNTTAYEYD